MLPRLQVVPLPKNYKEHESVRAADIGFLLLLTLLNVISYIDRQMIASFANWIVPELGLSNFEFGLVTGIAFLFFYAIGGLFMGVVADRVNRTRLIAFGLGLWSLLTIFSGAAKNLVTLVVPRMFIGVGESILTPASLSLLGDRFPVRWQGLVVGIYGMGVSIGLAASLFIVAYVEPLLGWRGCFYALGAVGLLLALFMLFLRETPRKVMVPELTAARQRYSLKATVSSLRELLIASPSLAATISGSMLFSLILGASGFEQLWLVQERGFDRSEIAATTAWISIFAGILGSLFGGYGGDLFLRWTGIGRSSFLALIMICLAPMALVYRIVDPDSLWFWVGVFTMYFQIGCFYAPAFSTIQELVPANKRATVVGFAVLMIQLAGVGVGNTTAGLMIDKLQQAGVAEPYSVTLIIYTLISLLCIPTFVFAGRRFKRDKQVLQNL
ncbi:MAG: MFS transporter [Porticoccaceae bacterium]|nr:MFS transporter [Porticoccaceae bacterium]